MEHQTERNDHSTRQPVGPKGAGGSGRVISAPLGIPRQIFKRGTDATDSPNRLRVISGGPMNAPDAAVLGRGMAPRSTHLDERTQRGLQTLAAGIAHHYNNLLMGIQGYLSLIRSKDAHVGKRGRERLHEIQKLVRSGSCFPVHFLEYLRNDLYEDRFRSVLSQIVYFYPMETTSAEAHQLDTERRIFFTRLNTAGDARFISVLVGGICRNYERMFKRMQKQLVLLAKDLTTSGSNRHCYFSMWRLVVRALKTIHRLSMYAAEAPRTTRLVTVHREIAECCNELVRRHPAVRVYRNFFPDEVQVRVNPEHFRSMIESVLENAVDAMPGGGDIRIKTSLVRSGNIAPSDPRNAGQYLTIQIQDSGEGMDASILDRVFDPFFTTRSETEHQGLGLASVFGRVRAMSGSTWVESEPGRGTRLFICLPAWSVVRHELQPMVLPDGTAQDVSSEIVSYL